jgi:hypothetical protein
MPTYAYQAVDGAGKRMRGQAQASSSGALTRTLEQRGLLVLEVAESSEASGGGGVRFGRRREVLEVTRAMAALLPVGMPLAPALNAASGVASGDVRAALHEVRARVERGDTLSSALAEHRRLFSPLYVGLIRAGERSGDIDAAFARLADQLERDEQLRGKVLSAAIYPMLLATAGSVAVTVLLFFVLPRFVTLLEGSGAKLPRSTATLLAFSSVLHRAWPCAADDPAAHRRVRSMGVEQRRGTARLVEASPVTSRREHVAPLRTRRPLRAARRRAAWAAVHRCSRHSTTRSNRSAIPWLAMTQSAFARECARERRCAMRSPRARSSRRCLLS